jgi:thiosulfate reductase cytochrome b subunit
MNQFFKATRKAVGVRATDLWTKIARARLRLKAWRLRQGVAQRALRLTALYRMRGRKEWILRHTLAVRVTHWINALAWVTLFMSGLQIFNAHPALYWGNASNFARPWLAIDASETPSGNVIGVTTLGAHKIETTGLLGYSGKITMREARAFPAWITVPSFPSLADGRRWHFFFAWVFVINGIVYSVAALISGHWRRDLLPTRAQLKLKALLHDIVDHALFRFPRGDAARAYNVLQKMAYLAVTVILLPLMILTGLTMSPGFNAIMSWTVGLLGGRQSARSLHFIVANLILLFVVVHIGMVFASGAWNNIRSMLTGRYAIATDGDSP